MWRWDECAGRDSAHVLGGGHRVRRLRHVGLDLGAQNWTTVLRPPS